MFPISDSIHSGKFPFFNLAIIAVTAYVFFLQLSSPDQDAFITQYALIPAFVDFANTNTMLPFVTAMFLHGGFFHIISNMWFLWVFGDDVEGHLGSLPYLLLYFASGIAGNVAQYLLMPDSPIPMLGASGAVAGILGAYYVLFPHSKIKTLVLLFGFITIMNISAPFMLGYWFLIQIVSGAMSLNALGETGGVAFFAHIGGFVSGVVFGKMFRGSALQQVE